ncbi:hypothetical protein Adt_25293 [Abeliophyllum distichum]|uniref:Uncharacterized protein n=1 Tax=Abeliophyllum distichum TaxID=126358 RepID=A0ABD1SG80_9LAMI
MRGNITSPHLCIGAFNSVQLIVPQAQNLSHLCEVRSLTWWQSPNWRGSFEEGKSCGKCYMQKSRVSSRRGMEEPSPKWERLDAEELSPRRERFDTEKSLIPCGRGLMQRSLVPCGRSL